MSRNAALELLQLERQIEPLQTRQELLKEQLRKAGSTTYSFDGGTVKVSKPGIPTLKGTELEFNESAFLKLSLKERTTLQAKKVVALVEKWTKTTAAKVSVSLNAVAVSNVTSLKAAA